MIALLKKYFWVLFVSMVPIVELRGAVPIGVGMGLPLWKMAAEMTGGAMTVESAPGVGTTVTAVFGLSHIDRLPLGDLPQTMATLIGGSPEKDFRLEFDYDGARFVADTREYRAVLGEEISLAEPEVLAFITGQVAEGIAECCPAPEKL